jgi:hypothetical protein
MQINDIKRWIFGRKAGKCKGQQTLLFAKTTPSLTLSPSPYISLPYILVKDLNL